MGLQGVCMPESRVEFDTDMRLQCSCGWVGPVTEVDEWEVEENYTYVARVCPGCETSVPEWGAFPSPEGVKQIAKGRIRDSLCED